MQHILHPHEHAKDHAEKLNSSLVAEDLGTHDKLRVIAGLEEELEASSRLEFKRATHLRDQIAALKDDRPTIHSEAVSHSTDAV